MSFVSYNIINVLSMAIINNKKTLARQINRNKHCCKRLI
ncbi:hypothetical protein AC79_2014 [Escherichia coli 8-415-05_S4_C1]|nr:hypothetical protein i02_2225 [Escherichia coli str. 'clone D i2']AER89710.1 hypothetical protein i14_2225 [Escherichia coli str. 'clone D i14']EDV66058.1 hypothetical protein EcF11_3359 [Escherichia coli F11]KEJ12142.1 hypothetical protein AC79_2014 [Escherichia coli 8-415-05_S4_C1]KEJ13637.1 hypothetical protein AD07_2037 [Escherichia coli 8-415-05_S4_C2]KEJ33290.1 hypothetical protein AD36_2070 [Escherichia coli 8-415-05_S4_C3]KEN34081.1 hypothetical protein AC54_2192 [Escherichia coli 